MSPIRGLIYWRRLQKTRSARGGNTLAEKLWMLVKTECVRGRTFATRAEANLALFEYIDGPRCPIALCGEVEGGEV
ncbi:IS3 family transposase [Streptomyces sp. NPDC005078]|uniref:IS3 family transposase n=1 Tax=Streptomyces sp. NPDC005078 TaxID=3154293 RepID=UPI0033B0116A